MADNKELMPKGRKRVSQSEAIAMGLIKRPDPNQPSMAELVRQGKVPEHLIGKYVFTEDDDK